MFDTIAITQSFEEMAISRYLLSKQGWKLTSRPNRSIQHWTLNSSRDSKVPRVTLTKNPYGIWFCRAKVTPATWLRRSNVLLSDESEIHETLEKLSLFISPKINAHFDSQTAKTSRVDFAVDFHLGAKVVKAVLGELSRVTLSQYNRTVINDTTVYFMPVGMTCSRKFRVYSKWHEVLSKSGSKAEQSAAQGVLRFESSFLKTRAIQQLQTKLHLPNVRPKSILTEETASRVIEESMRALGLGEIISRHSRTEERSRSEILCAKFGTPRAQALLGFLVLFEEYGASFYLIPQVKMDKRTYQKHLNDCKKAGVNPMSNTVVHRT